MHFVSVSFILLPHFLSFITFINTFFFVYSFSRFRKNRQIVCVAIQFCSFHFYFYIKKYLCVEQPKKGVERKILCFQMLHVGFACVSSKNISCKILKILSNTLYQYLILFKYIFMFIIRILVFFLFLFVILRRFSSLLSLRCT